MAALAFFMKSHTCVNPALCIRIRIGFGRLDLDVDPHWESGFGSKTRKTKLAIKIQKECHVLK
jgi:hypothetical protein